MGGLGGFGSLGSFGSRGGFGSLGGFGISKGPPLLTLSLHGIIYSFPYCGDSVKRNKRVKILDEPIFSFTKHALHERPGFSDSRSTFINKFVQSFFKNFVNGQPKLRIRSLPRINQNRPIAIKHPKLKNGQEFNTF